MIRSMKDLVAGALLMCFGIFVAVYGYASLPVGTLARMGPGMYPTVLGGFLAVLGASIIGLGMCGPKRDPIQVNLRPVIFVLSALIVFAVLVRPFGLFPALFALTITATRADDQLGLLSALGLALAISVLALLLFRVALGLPFPAFAWPLSGVGV
jgi:hypothetical protein